jgi:hypothetical protein
MLTLHIIIFDTFVTVAILARIRTGNMYKNNVNRSIILWLGLYSESIRFESRPRNYPFHFLVDFVSADTGMAPSRAYSRLLHPSILSVYDHISVSNDGALAWLPF